MLSPVMREKSLGKAEVRQVFHIAKAGTVAGCTVVEGKITRKAQVRLVRDSVVVFTGRLSSVAPVQGRRQRGHARLRVRHHHRGYGDLKEKDIIEAFEIETRPLSSTRPSPTSLAGDSNASVRSAFVMTVGIARLTLFLPDAHSLKGKAHGASAGQGSGAAEIQPGHGRGRGQRPVAARSLGMAVVGNGRRFCRIGAR